MILVVRNKISDHWNTDKSEKWEAAASFKLKNMRRPPQSHEQKTPETSCNISSYKNNKNKTLEAPSLSSVQSELSGDIIPMVQENILNNLNNKHRKVQLGHRRSCQATFLILS